jgi:hypothetical protein
LNDSYSIKKKQSAEDLTHVESFSEKRLRKSFRQQRIKMKLKEVYADVILLINSVNLKKQLVAREVLVLFGCSR